MLEGDRAAVERVDLLRAHAGDGGRLVLGVAGGDRDLGARGALALADELGDVLGERLGAERRLAQHDLSDRLVDDLVEARHVRALLVTREVDEAVEPREEELLADAHDLLDARHADPREADRDAGRARLDVVAGAQRRRDDGAASAALHRRLAYRGRTPAPAGAHALAGALLTANSRAADSGITPHLVGSGVQGKGQGVQQPRDMQVHAIRLPFELRAQEA